MWSPTQYTRFAAERRQPFDDLLALVERRARMRVADLGCGTGELTRELHDALGAEETIGIDNSETMLLKAGHFGGEMLRFQQGNIEEFVTDRPFDLIFSNAALHWVADHERLFARLTNLLSTRGQLAVQMPDNDAHLSHIIAAEVAEKYGATPRPDYVLDAAQYAEILHRLGYERQHVRVQIYGHLLPSTEDVVEWVRGALLTHYQSQLSEDKFADFLSEYRERLVSALGAHRPYFYTYERVLLWATY
ncbi:MAG TPA: methyltransferase domain-containing protein [Thermoanaerobaculia bacterium]|nr:methyltransferase domain-containing protein [Thermoanaerobaculia bacterium]